LGNKQAEIFASKEFFLKRQSPLLIGEISRTLRYLFAEDKKDENLCKGGRLTHTSGIDCASPTSLEKSSARKEATLCISW
jgi:hypothetical protein